MDAGVRIDVDMADLGRVNALVTRLARFDARQLVSDLVRVGEMQTKTRVRNGGPAPDGAPWKPNLEGTAILYRTGQHLDGQIMSTASGDRGEWGCAWEFAHIHQEGATIVPKNASFLAFRVRGKRAVARKVTIPPRPFVGVSPADAQELRETVTDFMRRMM